MKNGNLQDVIKVYQNNGFGIIETDNKAPMIRNWTSLARYPTAWGGNLDTATEAGFVIPKDIVVIDVDPRNFPEGIDSLQELSKEIKLDLKIFCNFTVQTANNGLHLYFKKNPDITFPNEYTHKGVELKQIKQQVIIPNSVLPDGRSYKLLSDIENLKELKELPQKFYDVVGERKGQAIKGGTGYTNNETDIKRVREILKTREGAIEGQNGDTDTFKVCCLGKDYGLSPDVFFDLLCEWNEKCNPPWKAQELYKKMINAYKYAGNDAGSFSVENMFTQFQLESLKETPDLARELQFNKSGGIKSSLKNVVLLIKNDESLKDKVGLNSFSGDKTWIIPPFWHKNNNKNYLPNGRIWSDLDAVETRYLLNDKGLDVSINLIFEAVAKIANDNTYHPVKEWLERLPNWDKVPRINTFFKEYCGSTQDAYTKEVARKMFCGIVARIYEPGCKFDYLPIFVGKQGVGKSTLLKVLSIHPSWFCDHIGDITNAKEVIPQTRGKLIVEWQELALFSKIDINHSKSFLSTSVDRVREAYHREAKDYPRQFIVVATTNQDKFLLDETGNRRMLPIELSEIKIDEVVKDLEQLYAEAVHLYKQGEKLYITDPEANKIAEQIRFDRFKADELEEIIVDWLGSIPEDGLKINDNYVIDKNKLQAQEVVIHGLKESPLKKGLINRVSRILRRFGYKTTRYRIKGTQIVKHGFVKNF